MSKKKGAGVTTEVEYQKRELPPGIPWQALGLDADHLFVIDGDGLFRALPRDRAGHMLMLSVCGSKNEDWAFYHYARWRKAPEGGGLERVPRSLQPEHIGQDIQLQCSQRGVFDPIDGLRMQGAWRGAEGDLILHCGDRLWIGGARVEPSVRERISYPACRPLPHPHDRPVSAAVGDEILAALSRWQFGRQIDALLVLGHIATGMLAGALRHRPNLLLLGEHAVGKTGLLEKARVLLGERMLLTSDATPAGITQRFQHSNGMIGLDEREATDNPQRALQLLALLRSSYTGSLLVRGGSDHKGQQFALVCAVMAASIQAPPMDAADRSRNVTVNVLGPPEPDPNGEDTRAAQDARDAVLGPMMLRRLADMWPRLQLEILPAWRRHLRAFGFDGRGTDTLGTLLGCAWVLLHDDAPTLGDSERFAADLETMLQEERADRLPSYERFLQHLFGISVDPMRKGEWRTLLELIKLAAGYGVTELANARVESEARRTAASDPDAQDAQRQLSRLGIRIEQDLETGDVLLTIANHAPVLAELLKGTPWQASPGLGSPWSRLLARAPGAVVANKVRFASGRSRAVRLQLNWALRGLVGPDPEGELAAWEQRESYVR